MIKHIIIGLFVLYGSIAFGQDVNLNVEIEGITSDEGKILYTIFSGKEGFPNNPEKAVKRGFSYIEKGRAHIDLDLPKDEYAVMVFHDEDENNKLKTNWIGMPKEGVGNSNNHQGIPSYKKSVFDLSEDTSIVIHLWYM